MNLIYDELIQLIQDNQQIIEYILEYINYYIYTNITFYNKTIHLF